jgi:hypothetical protein
LNRDISPFSQAPISSVLRGVDVSAWFSRGMAGLVIQGTRTPDGDTDIGDRTKNGHVLAHTEEYINIRLANLSSASTETDNP